MSDMNNFEQMLEDYDNKKIYQGEVVEGTVLSVTPDAVYVNINYKSDGIVTRNEYSNDSTLDLTTVVKVGDSITVKVLKSSDADGLVALSHKRALGNKVSEVLKDAFENQTVLTAKVTEVVKGGIKVVVDEVPVFIPASLATGGNGRKNLDDLEGTEISFIMSEYNPAEKRCIGNARVIIEKEKAEKKAAVLSSLQVGDIIEGEIKNVTNFGAFVDIGGVDGLLHISEMSWSRIAHPQDVFKKGDKVRVYVKEITDDKIALSAKFDEENPWANIEERFHVGDKITGRVARMTDFGAFVSIADGVDALLHVSNISNTHIDKPSSVLSKDQEIEAIITDINVEEKKIALSMKELLPEETEAAEAPAEAATEE
ncbi:MAG: S1 RNA-binding domain-containing protein [Lachnospiraceae bacterium]|nr:S1 RNA-binding domain-containing protein [Lachnospiraceae bacterium]